MSTRSSVTSIKLPLVCKKEDILPFEQSSIPGLRATVAANLALLFRDLGFPPLTVLTPIRFVGADFLTKEVMVDDRLVRLYLVCFLDAL